MTVQVIFWRSVCNPRSGYECVYALATHYCEQERAVKKQATSMGMREEGGWSADRYNYVGEFVFRVRDLNSGLGICILGLGIRN